MSLLFNLPHIFVVFPPGASGNFIANVMSRTLHRQFNDLTLSSTGNAHENSKSKLEFSDFMSCGLIYGLPSFSSDEEKFNYYKTKIEENYSNDTDIKISWSHDFSNIPLYKRMFPNCRILVVTQNSNREKLAILIQQELKNRLDTNGFVFLKGDPYLEQWRAGFKQALISVLGNDLIDTAVDIANNYTDPKYKPIVTFMAINIMLRFYAQENLTDPTKQVKFDYLNYCTVPRFVEDPTYDHTLADYTTLRVGPSYKDCLTEDCITMPYDVILDNNFDEFKKTIKKTIGITLDYKQTNFLHKNLDNYYKNQSPVLMVDPFKYYYGLGKKAQEQIMTLKGKEMTLGKKEYMNHANYTSSWEWTKERSKYHFDYTRRDQPGEYYFPLGRFEGDWSEDLAQALAKDKTSITWATRAHGMYYDKITGTAVNSPMIPQEEYDLTTAGYKADLKLTDVVERIEIGQSLLKMYEYFALEDPWVRLHIQKPGQMFNLHIDKLYDRTNDPERVIRIVVFLADWEPGQFYQYGTFIISHWKAGDTHTFNWRDVPHATANASRNIRPSLIMTGLKTDKTREILSKSNANTIHHI